MKLSYYAPLTCAVALSCTAPPSVEINVVIPDHIPGLLTANDVTADIIVFTGDAPAVPLQSDDPRFAELVELDFGGQAQTTHFLELAPERYHAVLTYWTLFPDVSSMCGPGGSCREAVFTLTSEFTVSQGNMTTVNFVDELPCGDANSHDSDRDSVSNLQEVTYGDPVDAVTLPPATLNDGVNVYAPLATDLDYLRVAALPNGGVLVQKLEDFDYPIDTVTNDAGGLLFFPPGLSGMPTRVDHFALATVTATGVVAVRADPMGTGVQVESFSFLGVPQFMSGPTQIANGMSNVSWIAGAPAVEDNGNIWIASHPAQGGSPATGLYRLAPTGPATYISNCAGLTPTFNNDWIAGDGSRLYLGSPACGASSNPGDLGVINTAAPSVIANVVTSPSTNVIINDPPYKVVYDRTADKLYVSSFIDNTGGWKLYAFQGDGTQRWGTVSQDNVPFSYDVIGPPRLLNGQVWVTANALRAIPGGAEPQTTLIAFDDTDGAEHWRLSLDGDVPERNCGTGYARPPSLMPRPIGSDPPGVKDHFRRAEYFNHFIEPIGGTNRVVLLGYHSDFDPIRIFPGDGSASTPGVLVLEASADPTTPPSIISYVQRFKARTHPVVVPTSQDIAFVADDNQIGLYWYPAP